MKICFPATEIEEKKMDQKLQIAHEMSDSSDSTKTSEVALPPE